MWASVRGLSLAGRRRNALKKILLVKIANSTYLCIFYAQKIPGRLLLPRAHWKASCLCCSAKGHVSTWLLRAPYS